MLVFPVSYIILKQEFVMIVLLTIVLCTAVWFTCYVIFKVILKFLSHTVCMYCLLCRRRDACEISAEKSEKWYVLSIKVGKKVC